MSIAIEQSLKERVKAIASKTNRTFNDIWQEVVLERWLARLAKSPYQKNFIFKGAMCLLHYIKLERETRDLDFLIKNLNTSLEDIKKYFTEVSQIDLGDGFNFNELTVSNLAHTHMKYPGYTISVMGRLGKTKTQITVDLGVGDSVIPTEITMKLLSTGKTPLFEKEIHLWAYPIESIFAEKYETAISRGEQNSRMKDYHDLILLIRSNAIDIQKCKRSISETFKNRGSELKEIPNNKANLSNLQKYWTAYQKSLAQMAKIELSENIKEITDEINQYLKKNLIF